MLSSSNKEKMKSRKMKYDEETDIDHDDAFYFIVEKIDGKLKVIEEYDKSGLYPRSLWHAHFAKVEVVFFKEDEL